MTYKLTQLLKVELQERPLRRSEGQSAPNLICALISIAGATGDQVLGLEAMGEARRILATELAGADLAKPSPRAKRACEAFSVATNSVRHNEFVGRKS